MSSDTVPLPFTIKEKVVGTFIIAKRGSGSVPLSERQQRSCLKDFSLSKRGVTTPFLQ